MGAVRGPRSDLKRGGGVGQPLGVAVEAARVRAAVPVLPQQAAVKQPSVQDSARVQGHNVVAICSPCQHVQHQAGSCTVLSMRKRSCERYGQVNMVWAAGLVGKS